MRVDTAYPELRATLRADTEAALIAVFEQMLPDVAARFDAGAKILIAKRWLTALSGVIEDRHMATAEQLGALVAEALGYDDFDPEVMHAWLAVNAASVATGVTENVTDQIHAKAQADEGVEDAPHPVRHVFGILKDTGSRSLSTTLVTAAGNFVARDTAEKAGATAKVWRTTSSKPRPSHARVSGESVALDEKFSNGLRWPGDPDADAAENAKCKCTLTIIQ